MSNMNASLAYRRGAISELLVTSLIVIFVLGSGGYWLYGKYSAPEQAGDPPYISQQPDTPSGSLSNEELLERLLTAVDRRDYATVEVYAKAIFVDRSDIDLDPSINGLRDPVIRAAINGDVQLFNALVVAMPAFGGFDERGRRPIHLAAAGNHPDAVRWLIEHVGADINDQIVGTGHTPLHLALGEGAVESINVLIELGANQLAVSTNGQLPIHFGVASNSVAGVSAYLDAIYPKYVDNGVSTQDDNGDTPLHIAARNGNSVLASALLQAGASKHILNTANNRPCDEAHTAAHDELAAQLQP